MTNHFLLALHLVFYLKSQMKYYQFFFYVVWENIIFWLVSTSLSYIMDC